MDTVRTKLCLIVKKIILINPFARAKLNMMIDMVVCLNNI